MKATELRIGNITSKGMVTALPMGASHSEWNIQVNYMYYDFDDVSPVPLTEEWLIKFGFNKEKMNAPGIAIWDEFYRDNFCIGNHGTGLTHYHFIATQGMVIEVMYVHELQNLFFAFKKQELPLSHPVEGDKK